MTNRAAAARYARALFEVSLKESDPEAVGRELARFARMVARHEPLAQVLSNPAIPAPRKQALVGELAARAGLSSILAKLLRLLAERDRLILLADLAADYERRLRDHLKILHADVTTAVPLADDRVAALGRALSAATGQQVTVTPRVDPSVIGGVVATIGSTVYDGSVKRQLERLREALRQGT